LIVEVDYCIFLWYIALSSVMLLNLQSNTEQRICEEEIPRTQNMRRKYTQNTE